MERSRGFLSRRRGPRRRRARRRARAGADPGARWKIRFGNRRAALRARGGPDAGRRARFCHRQDARSPDRVAPAENGTQARAARADRKSTRLNSSHSQISYAVFCLKKKKKKTIRNRAEICKKPL